MRLDHLIATPAAVYREVHDTLLHAFAWSGYKFSVTRTQVVDLLVLVAATGRTLSAVVRRRFDFCPETGRKAVRTQLPEPDALADGIAAGLHRVLSFSRRDRRRRWTVAIDTHSVPYYGRRDTPGIVGGPKKHGTHYSFAYATAVLIHKQRRYTVGLIPVRELQPHKIVESLFAQIDRHELKVGGVVLDSGFDSGETILWLQKRKLNFAVPLRRKGSGSNRRNDCFGWAHGTIDTAKWTTDKTHEAVEVRVLVWHLAGKKARKPAVEATTKREKNKRKEAAKERIRAFAFGGWGKSAAVAERKRARLGRRRYRERFGIETSYRQKNQTKGWTTSQDSAYRLLLEGIAHLLRQVWVLFAEAAALAGGLKPTAWVGDFTVADLVDFLAEFLRSRYPMKRCIPLANEEIESSRGT